MPQGNQRETNRLLRRLLKGDDAAWGVMVREYSGLLVGIAGRTFATYGFAAAHQDAEDAVAETWRNLLDGNGRLIRLCLTRGNLLQTLVVLTRNRAVDIMRRRKGITIEWEESHGAVDDGAGAEGRERPRPGEDALHKAVMALPDRERMLVSLFFLQRRKYKDIAALSGIPQNSIGPTLGRALRRLRQAIDPVA